MTDRFNNRVTGNTDPATDGFPIIPNDTLNLVETTRAIYVGGGGAITLTLLSGTQLVFANIPSGTMLPVRAVLIKATGTDASDLVGLV